MEIEDLEAVQNYTTEVYVLNGQYQSSPSHYLHFQTTEGGGKFDLLFYDPNA